MQNPIKNHAASKTARPWVFVLEDDREMAVVVSDALRAEGYEVVSLVNGLVAIADLVARQSTGWNLPDLIVTDVRLPGCTGVSVLERLRAAGCQVPAIVMSGFADEEIRKRSDELGVIAIFDKPFDLDELRAVARDQLGVRR